MVLHLCWERGKQGTEGSWYWWGETVRAELNRGPRVVTEDLKSYHRIVKYELKRVVVISAWVVICELKRVIV